MTRYYYHYTDPARVVPQDIWRERGRKKFQAPNKADRAFNSFQRLIGVELEVSGLKSDRGTLYAEEGMKFHSLAGEPAVDSLHQAIEKWHCGVVHDAGGFEIQSSPAAGDYFVNQVEELCGALADAQAIVNEVCGTHVHIDISDLTPEQIRVLLVLHTRLEPTLVKTQPVKRVLGKFCKPNGGLFAMDLVPGQYKALQEKFKAKAARGKYFVMNLGALYEHGTVEIRLHEGTINPREIVPWALAWVSIVEHAKSMTIGQAARMPKSLGSLLRLIPEESGTYIQERLAKYKDQWGDASTLLAKFDIPWNPIPTW